MNHLNDQTLSSRKDLVSSIKIGVANGTQKILGLGKFWSDLEISEAFLMSHEVSFFCVFFVSRSLEILAARSRSLGFFISAEGLDQNVSL